MKIRYVVSIAFCSLSIIACAPLQPKLQELQMPPERIVQRGYSLVPMNEAGWFVLERDQDQLKLGMVVEYSEEVYAIMAKYFRLPEYKSIEEIPRLKKEDLARGRDPQTIKKLDVVAYPKKGLSCFKSHYVFQESAISMESGKSGYSYESLGLMCLHPTTTSIGLDVVVTHRYFEGAEDGAFIEKATSVLDSVELTDL